MGTLQGPFIMESRNLQGQDQERIKTNAATFVSSPIRFINPCLQYYATEENRNKDISSAPFPRSLFCLTTKTSPKVTKLIKNDLHRTKMIGIKISSPSNSDFMHRHQNQIYAHLSIDFKSGPVGQGGQQQNGRRLSPAQNHTNKFHEKLKKINLQLRQMMISTSFDNMYEYVLLNIEYIVRKGYLSSVQLVPQHFVSTLLISNSVSTILRAGPILQNTV